ncbi:MAG: phosphotransferase family protein [Rubrobacteraceae bacterium]
MLSSSVADIVKRDPTLPGLATLLDPDAFAGKLRSSLPDRDVRTADITYVKYRPGESCLVGYRIEAGESVTEAYAKAYPRSDADRRLRRAREETGVPGPLGPGRLALEDLAAVVSVFPNDGRVKALSRVEDPDSRRRLLRESLPDRPDLREGALKRIAYKPERRCVAALLTEDGPQAVLKMHTRHSYPTRRGNAEAFVARGPLGLAAKLGHSDHYRTVVSEWLTDRPLGEEISTPTLDAGAVETVGAALAELHAQEPRWLAGLTRAAEAEALLAEAAWLEAVCPWLAGGADELARRLCGHLVDAPPVDGPVHGDFHVRQILLKDDHSGAAILDFDGAFRGDPATDLGNFVAHLERDALRGRFPPRRVAPIRDALLEGYRAATRRSVPPRVDLYAAVGLYRLAPRFFRYNEPGWPEKTTELLKRAEEVLDEAPASGKGR